MSDLDVRIIPDQHCIRGFSRSVEFVVDLARGTSRLLNRTALWSFGDGSPLGQSFTIGNTHRESHVYLAGTTGASYIATLLVEEGYEEQFEVRLDPCCPRIVVKEAHAGCLGVEPAAFLFVNNLSDINLRVRVDYGDGTQDVKLVPGSGGAQFTHPYPAPGAQTIRIYVPEGCDPNDPQASLEIILPECPPRPPCEPAPRIDRIVAEPTEECIVRPGESPARAVVLRAEGEFTNITLFEWQLRGVAPGGLTLGVTVPKTQRPDGRTDPVPFPAAGLSNLHYDVVLTARSDDGSCVATRQATIAVKGCDRPCDDPPRIARPTGIRFEAAAQCRPDQKRDVTLWVDGGFAPDAEFFWDFDKPQSGLDPAVATVPNGRITKSFPASPGTDTRSYVIKVRVSLRRSVLCEDSDRVTLDIQGCAPPPPPPSEEPGRSAGRTGDDSPWTLDVCGGLFATMLVSLILLAFIAMLLACPTLAAFIPVFKAIAIGAGIGVVVSGGLWLAFCPKPCGAERLVSGLVLYGSGYAALYSPCLRKPGTPVLGAALAVYLTLVSYYALSCERRG